MMVSYIAIDGDDIGDRIEYFILYNQPSKLARFTSAFQVAFDNLERDVCSQLGASIVFAGGDSMLVTVSTEVDVKQVMSALALSFADATSCTLSVGVGPTPRDALIALKMAKVSGKNRIVGVGDEIHGRSHADPVPVDK